MEEELKNRHMIWVDINEHLSYWPCNLTFHSCLLVSVLRRLQNYHMWVNLNRMDVNLKNMSDLFMAALVFSRLVKYSTQKFDQLSLQSMHEKTVISGYVENLHIVMLSILNCFDSRLRLQFFVETS